MTKVIDAVRAVLYVMALFVLTCTALGWLLDIRPAVVVSGSMEPVIPTGSIIFINEKDREIQKGDIIAFKSGGTEVAHRVMTVKENGYVTKGDKNQTADLGVVSPEMVTGTVLFHIPGIGYAVKRLSTVPGMIMLASVAAALLLITNLSKEEGCSEEE